MIKKKDVIRIVFSLGAIFLLYSCAGLNERTPVKSSPKKAKAAVSEGQSGAAPAQAASTANKNIEDGDFQRAIDLYHAEHRRQPRDSQLTQNYAKGMEKIKLRADAAFDKHDFAQAGKIYFTLRKNYAKYSHAALTISFNEAYLNGKLNHCRKSLSVQGFQEYRAGRIEKAIALWGDVLDMDPTNKEIKDAVRTAKTQHQNLERGRRQ